MASCPKCGKHPIRKGKDGRRKCRRCGFLPGQHGLLRHGEQMEAKALEIRDEGTFIPCLAVDMNPENDIQRWYLRRVGYPCNGEPNVIVTRLSGEGQATNDPYAWIGRTWPVAHDYIIKHWRELKDGSVIDVQFILGETPVPKRSERETCP